MLKKSCKKYFTSNVRVSPQWREPEGAVGYAF